MPPVPASDLGRHAANRIEQIDLDFGLHIAASDRARVVSPPHPAGRRTTGTAENVTKDVLEILIAAKPLCRRSSTLGIRGASSLWIKTRLDTGFAKLVVELAFFVVTENVMRFGNLFEALFRLRVPGFTSG